MSVNVFFIIVAIISIFYILYEIRREKLSISDSMFWLLGCVIIAILSIFPGIITSISNLVGIEYAPSLLFLIAIISLLGLIFKQVKRITKLEEKITDLAQNIAILKSKKNSSEEKVDKGN